MIVVLRQIFPTVRLIIRQGYRLLMGDRKGSRWHDKERLKRWFSRISPDRRLQLAVEFERFRRGARFVEH